jgi:CDP-glycerol glycerophosphotransferase (TagB/SpsB family)
MGNFISRIKYVKFSDIFSFSLFFISIIPSKIYKIKHPDLWLICEDKNEARDNGYWLFKYIAENKPEIDIVYAINKSSPDYKKVEGLGRVIQYGSIKHWVNYLAASKNISSQKGGKPNAALCYVLEIYGLLKNRRIFLQHGITKDDAKWLYYEVTKFSLFVCAAKPEYEYVKKQFKYPDEKIKLIGFCRYDNLTIDKNSKKQILIMPTWREWIAHPITKTNGGNEKFINTGYHKYWNGLINNDLFNEIIENNNIMVIFYPHRNMQKLIETFKTNSSNIIIADWRFYDVQILLKESAFLITDYSSIAMDFAYMRKPLIYYQFDQQEFRKLQYQEGYFSYENDGFGEIVKTEKELLQIVQQYIKNNFKLNCLYDDRITNFFYFNDVNNCSRNFEAIKNLS